MTDEKKPTNLVSIDCKKPPTEEEAPEYQERIVNHLKNLLELAEAGNLNHIAIAYEVGDNTYNSVLGISSNYFKMHYILKNTLPASYEHYYLCRVEKTP